MNMVMKVHTHAVFPLKKIKEFSKLHFSFLLSPHITLSNTENLGWAQSFSNSVRDLRFQQDTDPKHGSSSNKTQSAQCL